MSCLWNVGLAVLFSLGGAAAAITLPEDLTAIGSATDPATSLPLEVRTRVTGHALCLVPPGDFTMGSDSGDADEKPVHVVSKSAFYLGKYPVTNIQYEQSTSQPHTRGAYAAQDQHPVTNVSWNDASAYVLGHTQKFRLYAEGPCAIDIALRKAKGRAIIKKLEMYEVKSLPPGFLAGHYGQ